MKVEIVTIGDELLLGFTVDTNVAHLARVLAPAGVEVVRRATVGDAAEAIAAAVREALDRTGAVITTGGLGPTSDDLTKPAIATLFGRRMHLDEAILSGIEERWRLYGGAGPLPQPNRQQAMIPEGARVLENRHGSAPGIWLEDADGRWVAMLPGVPRELRAMTADTLLPLLRERDEGGAVVLSRTLRTTGIGESRLAEQLGPLATGFPRLPLAFIPSAAGVDLRLTARGMPADAAAETLDAAVARLRASIGDAVYGEESSDLAAVVLDLCRARALRIATAESCTGGLAAVRLTSIPGSSDVVVGGIVAYADFVKREQLGVRAEDLASHGAVSESVARQMAAGVCERLGAEVGIAITGVAGPGGGSPAKPVGTVWISVDVVGIRDTRRWVMVGDRDEIRQRAAQAALEMVRRVLLRDRGSR